MFERCSYSKSLLQLREPGYDSVYNLLDGKFVYRVNTNGVFRVFI
jgi:hypothetical protein